VQQTDCAGTALDAGTFASRGLPISRLSSRKFTVDIRFAKAQNSASTFIRRRLTPLDAVWIPKTKPIEL
jgi:hypothetical protein